MVEQGAERKQELEFAPHDYFLRDFSEFVEDLSQAESLLARDDTGVKKDFVGIIREKLLDIDLNFSSEERELFIKAFNLFSIKHLLPPFDEIPETTHFLKEKGKQDLVIEIGGPIAVGKTTLASFLAENIGAKMENERFTPSHNPFLARSYKNPDFMLRTQLSFLLDNVSIGLRGKYYDGRWVRDTSVWSDIFVFMEWRRQAGIVSEEEYGTYMNLVSLLDPLITRPDLLIMLKPNSIDQLEKGLRVRIEDNPEKREMERSITREDLEIVDKAGQEAARTLGDRYGINVFMVEVDPVEIYSQPDLRYETVYRIRERLSILKELLTKDPEEVAEEIVRMLATKTEPQVVGVHSTGMFAGKTSALNHLAEKINSENVIAFQPAAAIRYGPEHEHFMVDRDRRRIPALTIKDNRLADVISYLGTTRITPDEKPFVFIDEVMLFIGSDSEEALSSIEELRKMGFNVVFDGIDYTFQEEPFTFAHDLLEAVNQNGNWHEIEVGTTCKYCEITAKGTRRLKPDGSIADYKDQAFEAGEHYEPVCCKDHPSCVGQPKDFVRQPLPTEI